MKALFALSGLLFALVAVLPAVAQIAPGGGNSVQEGVMTEPAPCPDGSEPINTSDAPISKQPTDTSTPAVPLTGGAIDAGQLLCPPSGKTSTGGGVDSADTPAAVKAPSMK
jgi:hypothetical protein